MIILSLWLLLLCPARSIDFAIAKKNVYIESNSHYLTSVELQRKNAELIPTNISMQTKISSTIPSLNYYFDYFYYLSAQDVSCYEQSVQNQSYLYPCPFISNKTSQLRATSFKTQQTNQSIEQINDFSFYFIIDNTLFPYPIGAYSHTPINIDVSILVNMQLDSSYQTLSIRLIFINVTIFLIFIVIMAVLVYKTRELSKRMEHSKMYSNQQKRLNSIHQRESSDSEEEETETVRKMKISEPDYDGNEDNEEEIKEADTSMQRAKQGSFISSRLGRKKTAMAQS